MDRLTAMEVLVRVVETGSFSAVARECNINSSAVTRLVGQLEEHFRFCRKFPQWTSGARAVELAHSASE